MDKEWLDAALAQCANELQNMIKSEQAAIAKSAKEDAPAEESSGSEGPASPPPSDADGDDSSEASAPAEGPPSEASAPVDEASAPPPGAEASAPVDGAPDAGQEQAIEPAPTVEALQAEYMKLDPEALKMHYLAAKSALAAAMGAEQGGAPGAPAPEASAPVGPPAGAPPPAPPAGGAPMAMGEMKAGKQVNLTDGNGGEVEAGKLGKAESELADLRKQLAAQNTALLQLAEVVATPIRKSVKGLSDLRFIERAEESKPAPKALSKKEIQAVLSAQVRSGKLSKADKELVTQYSVGTVDVTKIEHLLASAK